MPEEVRADLLLGRDTLSPGLLKAGKAASDASSNVRQLTRDLYEAGKTRATPIIDLQDAAAEAKLTEVSAKLKELGTAVANPEIDVDDKAAVAKVADMRVKLDVLGKKVASPRITLEGLARAEAGILKLDLELDRLSRKRATPSVDATGGGLLSRLTGLFGGLGGAGGDAASAGGSLASGTFTGPAGLIAAILGSALIPAAVPVLLGGGAGLGGGALAAALGVKGAAALKTDAQAVAQARAAIRGGASGSTPTQRLALQRALAQQARDQAKFGAFVPFGGVITQLGNIAQGALGGALTGAGQGFSGGPGGHPGTSFLGGLTDILKQIGGFIKSIGPQLGDLFRASLPFVQAFVKVMEQFAKAVLPSVTQSLKIMQPDLPIITKGFLYLSQGIAGFIKDLGPGIKDSAIIFKASMLVVKGFLQLAGFAAAKFAEGIVKTAETVRKIAADVPPFFDRMFHDIASLFDTWRHNWAHIWDVVYSDTIGNVIRLDRGIVGWFHRLPGQILHALWGLGHSLGSFAAAALNEMWDGFKRIGGSILSWLGGLWHHIIDGAKKVLGIFSPSRVFYDIGKNLMTGLFHGIKDHTSSAVGAAQAAAHQVANAGAGVQRWAPLVRQALAMEGLSPGLAGNVLYQMQTESGGNPNAINLNDINARMGDPSRGLLQVIGSTFQAYHWPGTSWNIYDPLANIAAALNYARHVYGPSLMSGGMGIGSGHGYAAGGMITEPIFGIGRSGRSYTFGERGPELVVPGGGRIGATVNNYVTVQVGHGTHPVAAAQEIVKLLNAGAKSGVKLRTSILGPG